MINENGGPIDGESAVIREAVDTTKTGADASADAHRLVGRFEDTREFQRLQLARGLHDDMAGVAGENAIGSNQFNEDVRQALEDLNDNKTFDHELITRLIRNIDAAGVRENRVARELDEKQKKMCNYLTEVGLDYIVQGFKIKREKKMAATQPVAVAQETT